MGITRLEMHEGKVVHLITGLGSGGAERMLAQIASYNYGASAPEQVVITLMDADFNVRTLTEANVRLYELGMRRRSLSFSAFFRLIRILRSERPDVLMTWLYHADLLGTLAARVAGVRTIIWNVRCAVADVRHFPLSTRLTLRFLRIMSRHPWAVATNSIAGRKVHEQFGFRPRRWCHLPNGVDLQSYFPAIADRMSVRSEFAVTDDQILIGLIARVDPLKDYPTFFSAAERVVMHLPNVHFVLVGSGTDTVAVPDTLREIIHVTGERTDVSRLMRGLDVLVLCSMSEGFSNVVVEAMASAVPCVVTDVGDAALVVGDSGAVVQPGDPAQLADALENLIHAGRDHLSELGLRARLRAGQQWSIEKAAENYLVLWREAILSSRNVSD